MTVTGNPAKQPPGVNKHVVDKRLAAKVVPKKPSAKEVRAAKALKDIIRRDAQKKTAADEEKEDSEEDEVESEVDEVEILKEENLRLKLKVIDLENELESEKEQGALKDEEINTLKSISVGACSELTDELAALRGVLKFTTDYFDKTHYFLTRATL